MADFDFTLRFYGEGISPKNVDIREVVNILIGTEEAVVAIAESQSPEVRSAKVIIGLAAVEDKSYSIRFVTSAAAVVAAVHTLTVAINTKTFESIPPKARAGINRLTGFVIARKVDLDVSTESTPSPARATIRHNDPPSFEARPVRGETTLYGEVLRIGGAEPAFWLRLDDDSILSCDCTKEFAIRLAGQKKLYKTIGVHGEAQWHPLTTEILKFRAIDLLPYQETDVVTAFTHLRDSVKGAYDDLDDVDAFIGSLRGD